MNKPNSVYFSGFDTLRFVAASLVVFCHIELVRHYRGMPTPVSMHWIYETGKVAVSAFFVMSGFLITYLLLKEKEKSGTVSIPQFYLRRALRIWPLYYLLVGIIFFILPHSGIAYLPEQSEELYQYFGIKLLFFLLLMPQLLFLKFKPTPGAEQFWTIGAEEIFYFIWPWLVKKAGRFPLSILVLFIVYTFLKTMTFQISLLPYWKSHSPNIAYKVFLLLYYNRIDCIFIGAICACFFYQKNNFFLSMVSKRFIIGLAALLLIILFSASSFLGPFDYLYYSLLFSIIISAMAVHGSNPAPGIFVFLGKLSYGIYLWHFVAVFITFYLVKQIFEVTNTGPVYTFTLYALTYAITLALATLSYSFYERWFLRLKNKFKT